MKPISRREFLRTGSVFALGAVAIACGKDAPSTPPVSGARTLEQIIKGRAQNLQVITVGTELLPARQERVTFGLVRPSDQSFVAGATGALWFAQDRNSPASGPFPIEYHGDGLGDRGVYEVIASFPAAGTYLIFVDATTTADPAPLIGGAQVQIGVTTMMPKPGDPAITVATPTFKDARGVDPICTRRPEPCSMHAISLDAGLKNGLPTVLIIATPSFCQSKLCGPEVDLLQDVAKAFVGKANFVHVEVYKDDEADTITRQILSPAAAAWKTDQEPAIYYIDAAGVISERQLGPADRANMRDATQKLVS